MGFLVSNNNCYDNDGYYNGSFFRFDHGHVRKRYAFCAFACEAVWSVAVARTCQKFLSVLPFFAFGGGPDADCFGQIIAVEETASQIEEEIGKSGLI